MSDEPQRRRTSGSGRHAAPRRARTPRLTFPARAGLGRALPGRSTGTPARVAQGVLVVALAGSLGGFAAQNATAGSGRAVPTASDARDAVADAALDAVVVARAAASAGEELAADGTVDDARLAELAAATAELEDLLDEAGVRELRDASTASRSASRTADAPAASAKASDEAGAAAASDVSEASDAGVAADGLLSASDDGSLLPAADPEVVEVADDATSPDAAAPTTQATSDPTADQAADVPSVDEIVVPPVSQGEDTTTQRLRTVLARVVELSDEVLDTAQQVEADERSAQELEAYEAVREARSAAQEQALAEAAARARAQAAAEKAAERAAWKASLLGYPNGQIPASALCAPSFDSSVLLRCDAAEDLDALDAAYAKVFGTHLQVSDSYRSYAQQVTCRATKGWLCASPGTSNHGTGIAVDLGGGAQTFGTAQYAWLSAHAGEYGWENPAWAQPSGSKPEPWHWEYTR
ncbi:M15 family metallopeptidase [Cellulomonas gilvus]|uniref:Peptidase M15B and M15C DD-carboxypeptidase VanY/endolysin n=1 Tax=Cellulomonas gilvus (strain ATCC 13127 / NRRL B-14078) TaxID=593907 RepID=F8A4P0_CELGA|nr:M15 family metallopeptidase [Cellulomonas gilvus]AEI10856.1 peptidase M15B and M15C DD-carboxypeptidase VanY/endolysin [Cellulomonas gilvus ATCC 13127]